MMQRWRLYCKRALLGGVISLVAGCSVFPKPDPQARYTFPPTTIQAEVPTQPGVLFVGVPQANRLISSNLFLIQTEEGEIKAYKGTLWADNTPAIVRERLVNAFTDVQLFEAISADAVLRSNQTLDTYIQSFQVQLDQNGRPTVQIQINAKLVDSASSSILKAKRFYSTQVAASTDIQDVVKAFGQASDQLSLDLIHWLQPS